MLERITDFMSHPDLIFGYVAFSLLFSFLVALPLSLFRSSSFHRHCRSDPRQSYLFSLLSFLSLLSCPCHLSFLPLLIIFLKRGELQ